MIADLRAVMKLGADVHHVIFGIHLVKDVLADKHLVQHLRVALVDVAVALVLGQQLHQIVQLIPLQRLNRRAKLEIQIPFQNIHRVYPAITLKRVNLHQSVVKIDFINQQEQKDTVAFKMPYPPRWIQLIENNAQITIKTD